MIILTGRVIVASLCLITFAFEGTPELDDVENRFIYRLGYLIVFWRGCLFLAFDVFGLFPLE